MTLQHRDAIESNLGLVFVIRNDVYFVDFVCVVKLYHRFIIDLLLILLGSKIQFQASHFDTLLLFSLFWFRYNFLNNSFEKVSQNHFGIKIELNDTKSKIQLFSF